VREARLDVAAPATGPVDWPVIAATSRDRKLAGADLPPTVAGSWRLLCRCLNDRPPNTVTCGFPVVPRATPPSECGFHLPESLDPLPVDVSSSSQSSTAAWETDTRTSDQWRSQPTDPRSLDRGSSRDPFKIKSMTPDRPFCPLHARTSDRVECRNERNELVIKPPYRDCSRPRNRRSNLVTRRCSNSSSRLTRKRGSSSSRWSKCSRSWCTTQWSSSSRRSTH